MVDAQYTDRDRSLRHQPKYAYAFADLYSEKSFEQNPAAFYAALSVFARFSVCILGRVYLFVILGSIVFGWIAIHLGAIRTRLKRWPRTTRLLYWALMPRISEWHIALSPILVQAQRDLTVRIDVLTKSGTLYRGNVFEKRITADGNLATLILQNAQRMIRDEFRKDRANYEQQKNGDPGIHKPDTEEYWKDIPGELFLLNGAEIATVNVRHVRPLGVLRPNEDAELLKAFAALSEQLKQRLESKT